MARAPFNALIYPYIKVGASEFEYALFTRSDMGIWQGVSGGGEDTETALETARRETWEEAGIPVESQFIQLSRVGPIPVIHFGDSYLWGEDVYVIPQYCFGVSAKNRHIILSQEHTEYKWLKYQDAYDLLKYDGDKTALWELDRRLRELGPRD